MNFRNKESGFSFVEVMVAFAIVAIVMTSIFATQGSLLATVVRRSRDMARLFFAKQFMINSSFSAPSETIAVTLEKKLDDPETFLTYTVKPVAPESIFAKLPDLYVQKVELRWQQGGKEQKDYLVSFMFKPKLSEKKPGEAQKAQP
jgi:prepilin-type N-terminal cleavage/methylation domain-containing protein